MLLIPISIPESPPLLIAPFTLCLASSSSTGRAELNQLSRRGHRPAAGTSVVLRSTTGEATRYTKVSIRAGLPSTRAWISSSEKPLRRILGTMFSRMWP